MTPGRRAHRHAQDRCIAELSCPPRVGWHVRPCRRRHCSYYHCDGERSAGAARIGHCRDLQLCWCGAAADQIEFHLASRLLSCCSDIYAEKSVRPLLMDGRSRVTAPRTSPIIYHPMHNGGPQAGKKYISTSQPALRRALSIAEVHPDRLHHERRTWTLNIESAKPVADSGRTLLSLHPSC